MLRTILINVAAVAIATAIGSAASAETLTPNDLADAISTLQVAESDCLLVFPPDLEEQFTLRASVSNISNKLYADNLYRGHYVPGAGRYVLLALSARF